jgi:hypothetical protein
LTVLGADLPEALFETAEVFCYGVAQGQEAEEGEQPDHGGQNG